MQYTTRDKISIGLFIALAIAHFGGGKFAVGPPPIAAPGLNVLVVSDLEHRTPQQTAVVNAGSWQDYVKGKNGAWAVRDPNAKQEQNDAEKWRTALARPRRSNQWVVVSNGRHGEETELPATADALKALIQKYGG